MDIEIEKIKLDTQIERLEVSKILINKYDFFKRLDARLKVQYNRIDQVQKELDNVNIKDTNKILLKKLKISEIKETISEMEFIKNNIIDSYMEGELK